MDTNKAILILQGTPFEGGPHQNFFNRDLRCFPCNSCRKTISAFRECSTSQISGSTKRTIANAKPLMDVNKK